MGKLSELTARRKKLITQDSDKKKKGKIAIPDLQVGDILDFYIREEKAVELNGIAMGPDIFFLGDEYPVMFFKIRYDLDKKAGIDVMSGNGAPVIEEIKEKDNDNIILEHTERDLPKIANTLWTSPFRQLPYFQIRYGFEPVLTSVKAEAGKISRGPYGNEFKNDIKHTFEQIIKNKNADLTPLKKMEHYFGGVSKVEKLPPDSIINYLFNYYHWAKYGSFWEMDVSNERNEKSMEWEWLTICMSEMLRSYGIENDIIVVSSRNNDKPSNSFSRNQLVTLLRIQSNGKLRWICFNDFFQSAYYLNPDFQGEEAWVITRKDKNKSSFSKEDQFIKLPVAESTENVKKENLNISFDPGNMQIARIERTISESGTLKQDDQKLYVLPADFDSVFSNLMQEKTNVSYIADFKNGKNKERADEIRAAINKEKINRAGEFKKEVAEHFGIVPQNFKENGLLNAGLTINDSILKFTHSFTTDQFIKKAGNNFVFEVGKLIGVNKNISTSERKRQLDIYIPSTGIISYNFNITIPQGYTVKGIDGLKKKVVNDIASFTSMAAFSDDILTINVEKIYKKNFGTTSDWSKLLEIMDASADFSGLKILLEKK